MSGVIPHMQEVGTAEQGGGGRGGGGGTCPPISLKL